MPENFLKAFAIGGSARIMDDMRTARTQEARDKQTRRLLKYNMLLDQARNTIYFYPGTKDVIPAEEVVENLSYLVSEDSNSDNYFAAKKLFSNPNNVTTKGLSWNSETGKIEKVGQQTPKEKEDAAVSLHTRKLKETAKFKVGKEKKKVDPFKVKSARKLQNEIFKLQTEPDELDENKDIIRKKTNTIRSLLSTHPEYQSEFTVFDLPPVSRPLFKAFGGKKPSQVAPVQPGAPAKTSPQDDFTSSVENAKNIIGLGGDLQGIMQKLIQAYPGREQEIRKLLGI